MAAMGEGGTSVWRKLVRVYEAIATENGMLQLVVDDDLVEDRWKDREKGAEA